MSSDMGIERRQCGNDDCERIHDFCPLCGEKAAAYDRFETGSVETASLPDVDATDVCAEWAGEDLWLYWHESD